MGSGDETSTGPVRVLLVGFMASGKTSVGRNLADLLGWEFVDFDAEIEAEADASIPEIFSERGEEHFREVEAEVGRRLLRRRHVVLATGGGWAAVEGRLADLSDDTLSVWLRVSPEEAVRRALREPSARPLLDVPDPVGRARDLLARRESGYGEATIIVDAERGRPEDIARRIAERMKDGATRRLEPSKAEREPRTAAERRGNEPDGTGGRAGETDRSEPID